MTGERRVGRHLAILGLFLVLCAIFTYPLVLDPAGQLRPHNDPRAFTWVSTWVATRLFTDPARLFDGNILYPHSNTLAYSELLLVPTAVAFAPVLAASGNPILAYNVTVLLAMAASGWAAWFVAWRLTGSTLGGIVAGIVFALSPFRTGYYNILIMQASFAVPLAFLALGRFLETQRLRTLAWACAWLWIQCVSVWYVGIPLALLLAGLGLGVLLLRPGGWRVRSVIGGAAVVAALVLALLPVAWPYLETQRELDFERSLEDAARRPADLLSYLDAGRDHRFYRLADSGRYPGLFPGFTAYALGVAAFLWLRPAVPAWGLAARRLMATGLVAALLATGLFVATGGGGLQLQAGGVTLFRMSDLERAVALLLGLALTALGGLGWAWQRAGGPRALAPREWVALLGALTLIFVLLTLGPVMLLGGEPVGDGIYGAAYALFPGLRAIRTPLRIAVIVMLLLGLLAAFGVARAEAALAGRRLRRALALVPALLLVEYASFPLRYEPVRWDHPRPVYRWLATQPGDFAILEWPSGDVEYRDADQTMWSLVHGKRMVNGISGFVPEFTHRTWAAVRELPDAAALARLRSIHPLRFLIVHLDDLRRDARLPWIAWTATPPPGLAPVGRFEHALVFAFAADPERAWRWERTFSSDYVAARPTARLRLRLAAEQPEIEPRAVLLFNGRRVAEVVPDRAPRELRLPLPPPYPDAERNVLRLEVTYRLTDAVRGDPRYRVGRTGVAAPVDLVLASTGETAGGVAAIRVNALDVAPNRRGYNLAAIDPESGAVLARDVFDTHASPAESGRLAAVVRALPPGTIVVAAVRDEATRHLTGDAVEALADLGSAADLRRWGPFTSHALVGVRGAAPGSALEVVGPGPRRLAVGAGLRPAGVEVSGFRLE